MKVSSIPIIPITVVNTFIIASIVLVESHLKAIHRTNKDTRTLKIICIIVIVLIKLQSVYLAP